MLLNPYVLLNSDLEYLEIVQCPMHLYYAQSRPINILISNIIFDTQRLSESSVVFLFKSSIFFCFATTISLKKNVSHVILLDIAICMCQKRTKEVSHDSVLI